MTIVKKRNEAYAVFSFYSSLLFVTRVVLILEKIIKCRFKALLEFSNKFSSKLNALATWFSSADLTFWRVS